MLSILRLTGNLRKFTSIQLANLFESSIKTMAAKKENLTNGTAEVANTADNMDGIVKFMELVGNLKVSTVFFLICVLWFSIEKAFDLSRCASDDFQIQNEYQSRG